MMRVIRQNGVFVGLAGTLATNSSWEAASVGVAYCLLAMVMLAIPWRHKDWACAAGTRERDFRNTLTAVRIGAGVLAAVIGTGTVAFILCIGNAEAIARDDVAALILREEGSVRVQPIAEAAAEPQIPDGLILGLKTPETITVAGLGGLQAALFEDLIGIAEDVGWYALLMIAAALVVMYLAETIFDVRNRLQVAPRD